MEIKNKAKNVERHEILESKMTSHELSLTSFKSKVMMFTKQYDSRTVMTAPEILHPVRSQVFS